MKQDIRLYLAGERADLTSDPKILFNYKITDTQNPTAVKNNFTKSITLEGTDNNNAIFGEIYDLSRIQTYGTGNYSGAYFNPLRKAEFALYIDSELYEKGYFKLTEITKTLGKVSYSITLYGGLGEFLYNLEENKAGSKLEFKDLKIVSNHNESTPVPDLGFIISKETVRDAWNNINSYSSKYSTINFAPCYNGLPEDFSSDTTLINMKGKPFTMGNITGITSEGGWAKGVSSRDMTEWETRDLRSYLQRPVLRVKNLIESCCLPENNGGFEVKLDPHFFDYSNPYYTDAWLTCGMIKDIQGTDDSSDATTITGATIEPGSWLDKPKYYNVETNADFSEFSNLSMDLEVNYIPDEETTAPALYTSNYTTIDNNFTLQTRFVYDYYRYYSAIVIQLVAYDELGNVVATSAAYQLMSEVKGHTQPDFTKQIDTKSVPIPEWKTLYGYFKKTETGYTWCDMSGKPQKINFRFPSNTSFYSLKLRYQRPYETANRWTGLFKGKMETTSSSGGEYFWPSTTRQVKGNHALSYYTDWGVRASQALEISDFKATATRYGGFLSGKEISQDRILTLGVTPASFLLSYIKLFGLHIWKDPVDKIIYIMDRDTYYKRDEIVDIQEFIDRGKAMKITPQVAQTKWYDFNTEQNESEANEQYNEKWGTDFGLQRVNTSYDFDAGTNNVYEGDFKGAIQVLESSHYYNNDYEQWPVFIYNGFTLTTYRYSDTTLEGTEQTVNTQTGVNIYPFNDKYAGFDLFDKPQFHTADNSASDGAMSLLFFNGFEATTSTTAGGIRYFLTDDIEEMVVRNAKQPCWILTESETDKAGNKIGIEINSLPHFSRYKIYKSNGYITHSWDFGRTQETYIPNSVLTEGSSIYERCWKNYIADMYDTNGRILSCYCLIRGQVNPEWLRRFYYFDNSIWRLNTIKEYNPGAYQTTMCEFLKVQDVENYALSKISNDPITKFYLPGYVETGTKQTEFTYSRYYTIPNNVSSVTVDIEVQDGGVWYFGDGSGGYYGVTYDDGTAQYFPYDQLTESGNDKGYGTTREVFNIGANTSESGRTFIFNIVIYGSSGDYWYYIYLRQEAVAVGSITAKRFAGAGNVRGEGGTVLLTVTSSSPWTASTPYNYTTLDRTTGPSGSTTVQMAVTQNNRSDSTRLCRINFVNAEGGTYTFNIHQNPYGAIVDLEFNSDTRYFDSYTGGTINGNVACPTALTSWEVITCPEWITVSPESGETGVTQLTLTASANPDSVERSADVTVLAGGQTSTIQFSQPGAPGEGIKITLSSYNFDAVGGQYRGTIYSSEDGWRLSYSNWLLPSVTSGNAGTTNIILNVAANSTGYGRLGYLQATSANYSDNVSLIQDQY